MGKSASDKKVTPNDKLNLVKKSREPGNLSKVNIANALTLQLL